VTTSYIGVGVIGSGNETYGQNQLRTGLRADMAMDRETG
jgi:hypothetical protein